MGPTSHSSVDNESKTPFLKILKKLFSKKNVLCHQFRYGFGNAWDNSIDNLVMITAVSVGIAVGSVSVSVSVMPVGVSVVSAVVVGGGIGIGFSFGLGFG